MKVTQEQLETLTALIDELKGVRRVRTPRGSQYYGQPIGTPIVRDTPFDSTALLEHPAITSLPPALGEAPLPDGYVRMYHQTDPRNLPAIREEGLLWDRGRGIEGPKGVWISDTPFYNDNPDLATIEIAIPAEDREKMGGIASIGDIPPEQFLTINEDWHDRVRYFVQNERYMDELANGVHDDVLDDENFADDPAVRALRYIRDNVFEYEPEQMPTEFATDYASARVTPSGYISNLVVDVNERGEGHGTELMQQIIEQADKYEIELTTNAREELHPFYERFGFEVVDEQRGVIDTPFLRRKPVQSESGNLETFAEEIEDSVSEILSTSAEVSRDDWVYNNRWPETYLEEASSDVEYRRALHDNLRRMGWGDEVVLIRRGTPQDGKFANASLDTSWQGRGYGQDESLNQYVVPLSSIVGIGHANEAEVFFALDDVMEEKSVRRVRTPAGVEHYGQPINSIIVPDVPTVVAVRPKDPYSLEEIFEDGGQGVLPGMPEKPQRNHIRIVGSGTDAKIDISEFDTSVRPYTPTPTKITPTVVREQREKDLIAIQEIDIQSELYEETTSKNGGLLSVALRQSIAGWISPEKSKERSNIKISVNEQITRRILDHAAANPEFMANLNNYEYKSRYYNAMYIDGVSIIKSLPELKSLSVQITEDEYRNNLWQKPNYQYALRSDDGSPEFFVLNLDDVSEEIQFKIAKSVMLKAILSGSDNELNGESVDPNDIPYHLEAADNFEYSEVVVRFLTRSLVDKWAATSGDHDKGAVILQKVAMEKFGISDVSTDNHLGSIDQNIYEQNGFFYRAYVDAVYENTQDFFKENGIETVKAYRGMKWLSDEIPDWAVDKYYDPEQRINEEMGSALENYIEEYMQEHEVEIEEEILSRLEADFNSFWANREDEFWEDADFDVETASEEEKDDYRTDKMSEYNDENWQFVSDVVKEEYEESGRNRFYDWGVDAEVRNDVMEEVSSEMRPTGKIQVESQPLSSWSTHEGTAEGFSSESGFYGLVIAGQIPVERIFSTCLTGPGCLNEGELVVVGDYDEVMVR